MNNRVSKWWVGLLIFSIAAVASMSLIQTHVVPGYVEIAIRAGLFFSAPLAVATMLALGVRSWIKFDRSLMQDWRNGLGLSSFVLLAAIFAFRIIITASWAAHSNWASSRVLDWFLVAVVANDLAFVLAFSLRGNSRFAALATSLLMMAWQQSTMYA
ncbi:MAG TPA: hypothetical protein VGF20_02435 [Candidatus Acidoferrum sp.]